MTQRRPPTSNPDATALLERPGFSRSDAGDTDPGRQRARAEAPTGRYDDRGLDDLEDYRPSELPSAYVSEFDVSDLDGDVVEAGAPTTIMQLPPEMMSAEVSSFAESIDRSVEVMKWRAGPLPAPAVAPPDPSDQATLPTLVRPPVPLPLPPPPVEADLDPHGAATQPALSIAMVRAAVGADRQAVDVADAPTGSDIMLPLVPRLRATIEAALTAVLAAQSSADDDAVPPGVHEHLARAVELLSVAQELGDDL